MRSINTFLGLTLPRVQSVLERVSSLVWQTVEDLTVVGLKESTFSQPFSQIQKSDKWQKAIPGEQGIDAFSFSWYRFDLETEEDNLWLNWNHEGESTLYYLGTPYAGFDREHFYHKLPAKGGSYFVEVMRMSPEQVFSGARLCHKNDLAWKVKYDLEVLLNLAMVKTKHLTKEFGGDYIQGFTYRQSPEYLSRADRLLLRRLDDGINLYEKNGLAPFSLYLDDIYREFTAHPLSIKLLATAQAHLDPVHMWPENVGDFKINHTFSTADRLMEEYGELTFEFSQPGAYEKVKNREPDLFNRVCNRIKEGRWELEGGFFVESDVNLPCGEALTRSLLLGQRRSREYGGEESLVLWLPDTFGFSACLPQIMKQCGVPYFYTTKMHWNPVTHFPYSSFKWQGHDGSEVIAHLSQHHNGYMLNGLPEQMINVENIYRQSDVHNESLAPVGYGDGGGGITAEQIERVRRQNNLYGVPRTNFGRVRDYFKGLNERRDRLPSYKGELYLEYHRGIFTSRRRVKELYREMERNLQNLEAVYTVQNRGPIPEKYWERLSLMQFHDIITGSMLDLCTHQITEEMESLNREMENLTREALEETEGKPCIFNPLPMENQIYHAGQIMTIPPLTGVTVTSIPQTHPPVKGDQTSLDNGKVQARFTPQGEISSLVLDGKTVKFTDSANSLVIYKEMPAQFDIWNIDRQSLTGGERVDSPAQVQLVDGGPNRKELHFIRELGEKSQLTIIYTLDGDSPVLKIVCEIDWQEPECLLKAEFPTKYQATKARFGTPYGSVLRPAQPGMPYEETQWESGGSRWACLFDEGEQDGIALITKDSYGFSAYEGVLTLSLVRSPKSPESSREKPVYTDLGKHRVEYALGYHDIRGVKENRAHRLADTLFTPCLIYVGNSVLPTGPVWEAGESLVPCWVRPVEGGSISPIP
jgi:alpha-mannosidase